MLSLLFGGFQALMPVLGYLAGIGLEGFIRDIDHWIAFGLLAFIGGKMIHDSRKEGNVEDGAVTLYAGIVLALATSIDALMVGLSFAFLEMPILAPAAIIGAVTFILCFLGFGFGSRLGKVFGTRVRAVGGTVLILIGVRILIEHLFFQA